MSDRPDDDEEDDAEDRSPKRPRLSDDNENDMPVTNIVHGRDEVLGGFNDHALSMKRALSDLQPLEAGRIRPEQSAEAAGDSQDALEIDALLERDSAQWTKDKLPPPQPHELEFLIKDPKSYRQGKSVLSEITSLQGSFRFRLLVFPMGTESTGKPEQLAAFVEVVPPESCVDETVRWAFEGVKYQISVVNWKDYRRTVTQNDTFTFQKDSSDRGWHRGFLKATDMTLESGWLNEEGELCLRAACSARRPMLHIFNGLMGSSRRSVGYVGLKNHGATCYMNCLLQTHFHTGRFRHIVYSIDCQESAEQAAASGDDLDGNGDERPALPLLVALQNLFYRLQTSEAVVSCRELMRSFGWDTADAFMQHDAQELNRLLCDRLEEQMKGTPMDGAIKRLFEGEFENYIECVEIDYTSKRDETFYDLQLNVRNDAGRDLTSLEESLRDFISEETLEDENAYDAGSHGKQKARKGIRFKRFPPVLYIQLKRFMFDAERMDMCKLNGRLEFPQVLDLEAFAPGSGTYLLHTVVVHSGGVSSGHYYAFVRARDGENGSDRWVKFDDEQVTVCSEQAAVEDNYGGEDSMVWNYFTHTPQQLAEKNAPTVQRIHNAYMLSYVRADQAENILAPPKLDDSDEAKPYRAMVERCAREARLADERKRAKVEQMNRIEVRMLLERDLTNMEGFWSHHDLPCTYSVRMSRDQCGEDLYLEAERILSVPHAHIALFLLHTRKTRQTRFKFMNPHQPLRIHIPGHSGSPHSTTSEPHFVVLCLVSRGYDIHTLEWTASPGSTEVPHEIFRWTDDICMLVVKYFCPTREKLVTLGCYYGHVQETLEEIARTEMWLEERLKPFVLKREVAPFSPSQGPLLCFEEYCFKSPKDILDRNMGASIEKEGLYTGDILILQPAPHTVRAVSSSSPLPGANLHVREGDDDDNSDAFQTSPRVRQDREDDEFAREVVPLPNDVRRPVQESEVNDTPPDNSELADEDGHFPIHTARDLCTKNCSQVHLTVKLYSPEAPWCPDGVPADGLWGQPLPGSGDEDADLPVGPLTPGVQPASEGRERLPGEVDSHDFVADMRWPLGLFVARIIKALGIDREVDQSDQRCFWLFDRGPPSAYDDTPVHRTEAAPPRRRDRLIRDLLPRSFVGSHRQLVLHAVLLPARPSPPMPRRRPVAVHFFGNDVREVGAHIFHVGDVEVESLHAGEDELDSEDEVISATARPTIDPAEVLELARRFLMLPGNEDLCRKLAPPSAAHPPFERDAGDASMEAVRERSRSRERPQAAPPSTTERDDATDDGAGQAGTGQRLRRLAALNTTEPTGRGDNEVPLLRLVDIDRQRIRAVYRPSSSVGEGTATRGPAADESSARGRQRPVIWQRGSRSFNFFANALRVEPDWDCDLEPLPCESNLQGTDGSPQRRRAQMAEVYHTDQRHSDFGHPFLLRMTAGDQGTHMVERVKAKLNVPDEELKLWRFCLVVQDVRRENGDYNRVAVVRSTGAVNDLDEWPSLESQRLTDDASEDPSTPSDHSRPFWSSHAPAYCIERLHPANRTRSPVGSPITRASALRGQKPLMIR